MHAEEQKQEEQKQPYLSAHKLFDPAICNDGGKHQWDGEPLDFGWGCSVTCSKCGRDALSVDMFVAS